MVQLGPGCIHCIIKLGWDSMQYYGRIMCQVVQKCALTGSPGNPLIPVSPFSPFSPEGPYKQE